MKETEVRPVMVFVGHSATRTGAPISLLKIIRWFVNNSSFKIVVVLNAGGPLCSDYESLTETHLWNSGMRLKWPLPGLHRLMVRRRQLGILRKIKEHRPVCIFNNTGVNGKLISLLKAATAAAVVSRIPELEAFMRRNAYDGSVQEVIWCSDHFIAVSEAVRRNLHARHAVPLDRISVAFGACDVEERLAPGDELRRRINAAGTDAIVCGCGTMDWRKGYDLFVQTAFTVCQRRRRSDIKFVWIGSPVTIETGIEYDYEIELLGLEQNFFRTGEVDFPSRYFAEADVFFLSSREDPFPLVMLEAARQGRPIVCFENSGGAAEFVDGDIGALIPILDVNGAAEAIIDLVDNKAKAREKGMAAALRSRAYTVERMCEKINRLVLRAVHMRRERETVLL